jgi:ribonuclease HI
MNAEEAEARACAVGLQAVARVTQNPLVLESDNASVVATMKNSSQYRGALWRTYEEVTSLKDRFPDFKVGHIGRSSNTVAHQHSFLARTQ